jgi:hypothetical protein
MIAQAVFAVKPFRAAMWTLQRPFRARINRDRRSAKLRGVERIPCGLGQRHIARNRRDGKNFDLRIAQRHNERDGIVGSSVGVNQELLFHAQQDSKSAGLRRNVCLR